MKNDKKIIINTENDLLKYNISDYTNTKLFNFEGEYYKKLYKEAIDIENGNMCLNDFTISDTNIKCSSDISYIEFEIFYKTEVIKI